jgi:hypothetical protein
MVSLPFYPEDPDAQAVLGDDLGPYDPTQWRLFRYYPDTQEYREYPEVAPFAPGLGYWLISKNGGLPDARGRAVDTTQTFAINLAPGWNQIGNPFYFPVDWGEVMVSHDSIEVLLSDPGNTWVDNALWGFQSIGEDKAEYQLNKLLIRGEGYWIYNHSSEAVLLLIPNKTIIETGATTATAMDIVERSTPQDWSLRIKASQESFVDSYNFLGGIKGTSLNRDAKDISEPPPISSEQVRLYFIHLEGAEDIHKYATDYRPPLFLEGQYEFVVESGNRDSIITLSWSELASVPQNYEVTLIDPALGKVINMREEKGHSFYPKGEKKRYFKIIVTNTNGAINPSIKNIINQTAVNKGDTLYWDTVSDGLGKADVYLGIVLPSGDFVCLLDMHGKTTGFNNPAPIATNRSITSGTSRILSYRFTGNEPKGDYRLFAIFTKTGSDPLIKKNWLAYDLSLVSVR